VSEGRKVEGKKYGGDALGVLEFLQIDLLFFTTRFGCFVRKFGSLQPAVCLQFKHAWNPSSLWGK